MKNLIIIVSILLVIISVNAGQITLDHTSGTWDGMSGPSLLDDCPATLYFRVINDNPENVNGMTNGFKIWTVGNTPYNPSTMEIVYPGFHDFFDLVSNITYISNDGNGEDYVGYGGSKLTSTGLPTGFNEVVFALTIEGVERWETICVDSSFFPPTGQWLWAPGGAPNWDGPYCFTAEIPPCLPVYVSNWVDTLYYYGCDTLLYDFIAVDDMKCKSNLDEKDGYHIFKLWDGPGTLDSITGEWVFIAGQDDLNTIQTLNFGVYDVPYCLGNEYTTVVKILDSKLPGDLNQSCTVDVGDLVFLVNYMFAGGPPPPFEPDGDVNGDDTVDIGDLVYLVNYMFAGGPPPVDPPPIG